MIAYLGLGSNLDQPRRQVLKAITELQQWPGITVTKHSALYQTQPVGPQDQPDFINAAVEIDTDLSPQALLVACQALEQQHGRVRQRHWGERTLDIDILLYGDVQLDTPALTIPHPRMHEREFVLRPLADIAPDLVSRMQRSC